MAFLIGNRRIGGGASCFIIAEAGVNHNGRIELALALVDAAAAAGADAVKFQTFDPERLASGEAAKAAYQEATTGGGSQIEMLRGLTLSHDEFRRVERHCRDRGIVFMSTPFDAGSADFLATLGVPAFKMPSGEVDNLPLLVHVAAKGVPVILSTGMATLGEVERAVSALRRAGSRDLALLHCVSNYPAAPEDTNLRAMATMGAAFGVPVGYSDHTLGLEVSFAAVALGATILEKHFTLDRDMPGPDHRASIDPQDLAALVAGVRKVEAALGHGRKEPAASEAATARIARRSLFLCRDMAEGEPLAVGDLEALRPAGGIPPSMIELAVGRRVARPLAAGTRLAWSDLS